MDELSREDAGRSLSASVAPVPPQASSTLAAEDYDAHERQGRPYVTREHKLALIIGFALLMVVGVLVGEHFSKSRTATVGTEVATAQPEPVNTIVEPIEAKPSLAGGAPANPPVAAVAPAGPGTATPPAAPAWTTTTISLVPGGQATNPPPAPASSTTPSLAPSGSDAPKPGFVIYAPGTGPSPAAGLVVEPDEHPMPIPSGFTPVTPNGPSANNPGRVNPSGVTPLPLKVPEPAALPISKGKLIAHPVAQGENLAVIARKYYGDARLATRLADANKGKVGPNNAIRQGVTLRIPPKDVLLGEAVLAADAIVAPGRTGPTPGNGTAGTTPMVSPFPPSGNAPMLPAPQGGSEYVVKKGDTLGVISQKLLGTKNRAKDILALNKGLITNADDIKIGMKLKVPAR